MEPLLPDGSPDLEDRAREVVSRSATLGGQFHPVTRDSVVELLRIINSCRICRRLNRKQLICFRKRFSAVISPEAKSSEIIGLVRGFGLISRGIGEPD
jgi:hypothetical protein